MQQGYWILNPDHSVEKVNKIEAWVEIFRDDNARRVALTRMDGTEVSTVFLGLDHNFRQIGKPLLFETMVFGGQMDQYQARYSTWDEAVQGHKKAVRLVKQSLKKKKKSNVSLDT